MISNVSGSGVAAADDIKKCLNVRQKLGIWNVIKNLKKLKNFLSQHAEQLLFSCLCCSMSFRVFYEMA